MIDTLPFGRTGHQSTRMVPTTARPPVVAAFDQAAVTSASL